MLRRVLLADPIVADYARDYAPLKTLSFDKYLEL